MGGVSIWHWVVVGVVVMLLFGRGKISDLMGDMAKGIKAFKKGMAEDETTPAAPASEPPRPIDHRPAVAEPIPTANPTLATNPTLADRKLG